MASHPLDHLNDSRAWEVITTLSLCSFSICSCIFSSSSSSFIIDFGQIAIFLINVAKDGLRVELELRRNDNRVCFRVVNYDTAIVFFNFDLNFCSHLTVSAIYSKIYLAVYCFKLNYSHCFELLL